MTDKKKEIEDMIEPYVSANWIENVTDEEEHSKETKILREELRNFILAWHEKELKRALEGLKINLVEERINIINTLIDEQEDEIVEWLNQRIDTAIKEVEG